METKSKLGQEAAFATSAGLSRGEDVFQEGISKRLYIATAAMQGMLANSLYTYTAVSRNRESFVKLCYDISDEMLKQEQDEN
jgi:hypothetical protein